MKRRVPRVFLVALSVVIASALPAIADDDKSPQPVDQQSHWGIAVGGVPRWKVPGAIGKAFDRQVDISGNEFAIGVERGRDMSGSWGVSFIHKGIANGSRVDDVSHSSSCLAEGQCYVSSRYYVTQGVSLIGLEVHKYVPFVTIKRRAQIGMNFGGGFMQFKGQVVTHKLEPIVSYSPVTYRPTVSQGETVTTDPAKTLLKVSSLPVARVEVAAAAIIAPGLKLRVGGGLNFPSYPTVSIGVTYLFGSRWQ